MIASLSALDLGRLRMSVGYGTHKKGRPLSPVEVGFLIRRAREKGASLDECAKAMQLSGTGHIGRFERILDLPDDLRPLVDWGSGRKFIGFSSAVELQKIKADSDRRAVAQAILSSGLSSKEIRQIAQIRRRSGRTIEACLKEVLDMRPQIEKRYVFVGSVNTENVERLGRLTQAARDAILRSGIDDMGIRNASGRLGERFFTLVGGERFDNSMREVGKENIERRIRVHISKTVENATSCR